jgi:hypothetical protein
MSQYADFDMEPPLRNLVATSLLYIIASPLTPVLGAIFALIFRGHSKKKLIVLSTSLAFGVLFIIFDFWFRVELFEGVSFVG